MKVRLVSLNLYVPHPYFAVFHEPRPLPWLVIHSSRATNARIDPIGPTLSRRDQTTHLMHSARSKHFPLDGVGHSPKRNKNIFYIRAIIRIYLLILKIKF